MVHYNMYWNKIIDETLQTIFYDELKYNIYKIINNNNLNYINNNIYKVIDTKRFNIKSNSYNILQLENILFQFKDKCFNIMLENNNNKDIDIVINILSNFKKSNL
jgi:hypothetical protein